MVDDRFPKDWKKKKLSDVGFSYSGLKSKSKKDFDEDGNAQFVTYRNINRNYFVDKHDLSFVQVEEDENQNHVLKGDVLFTGSSETPEEVAFSSVMKEEIKNLYLNSFSFGYRFNNPKEFLPEFYGYYFRGPNFRKNVFPLAQGSTRYNLSKNEVLKIDIPVPSFKEQQKIASILSSVDEAIEKTEKIIKQTHGVKKGLLYKLFKNGVNHSEFKNTSIGRLPMRWEAVHLEDIVEQHSNAIKPGPFGSALKKEFYVEKGYKVYGQEQVIPNDFTIGNYYIDEDKYLSLEQFKVQPGDLLVSLVGTYGKIAIVPENIEPGIINPRLIKITFDKSLASEQFYKHYMSSNIFYDQLSKFSQVGTMGVINSKTLKSIVYPLPPLDEQIEINNIIDSIDDKINTERIKLLKLKDIKQGLMQQLLTGKVRVPLNENEEVPQ